MTLTQCRFRRLHCRCSQLPPEFPSLTCALCPPPPSPGPAPSTPACTAVTGFSAIQSAIQRDGAWFTTAGATWPHNLTHPSACRFFNYSTCAELARNHTYARTVRAGKKAAALSSRDSPTGYGWLEADAGQNGWLVGHWAGQYLRSWAWCAGIQACIAPHGTHRRNHRQDQSSLNLLIYQPQGLYDAFVRRAPGPPAVVDGIPRFLHPEMRYWHFRNKKKKVSGAVIFIKHHTGPFNAGLVICLTNRTQAAVPV